MEYVELPPPPELADVIRCFWFLRGHGGAGQVQPVVPDGRVELVLHLAEPFSLMNGGRPTRQAEALLSGQLRAPIHLATSASADVVGIRFRTAAAGAALRLPLHALTDQVVPLREMAASLAPELLWAASRHADPHERAERMARLLASRLDPSPRDRVASAAVQLLAKSRTASPVRRLAKEAGVSLRTLERRVQAAVGLSPKLLHRVMRFRRAFAAIDRVPAGRWAHAALAAGYYDQAHFIRDFRRFAGAPPSAFLSAEPELARAIMRGETGD